MKKLIFILTFIIIQFSNISNGFANDCSDIKVSANIKFSTSYGKLKYDFTKTTQQITFLAKQQGIAEKGLFASGLATIDVNWEISTSSLGNIMNNSEICVIPTNIDIYIGFTNPIIYISNRLKPHSCKYNLVLRHEQTHQQINKTALDYFIPIFKKEIYEIITNTAPIKVSNSTQINAATNELTQIYSMKISPIIKEFKKELLTEQSKLDNHKNYEYESTICNK